MPNSRPSHLHRPRARDLVNVVFEMPAGRRAEVELNTALHAKPVVKHARGKTIAEHFSLQGCASAAGSDHAGAKNILRGLREPQHCDGDAHAYIKDLTANVDSGRLELHGNPWVLPASPLLEAMSINRRRAEMRAELMDATEVLCLVLRPKVFIWAPHRLDPGLQIHCPACGMAGLRAEWQRPRTLHSLDSHAAYVTVTYRCSKCPANTRKRSQESRRATKSEKAFIADSTDIMRSLPGHMVAMRDIVDTGRVMCEASVGNFVRALSTRASWAATASVYNEMKETAWMRSALFQYLQVCEALSLTPETLPSRVPSSWKLQERWVREFFVADSEARRAEVFQEICSTSSSDVLAFDWTVDVAKRYGANFMFNVMCGVTKKIVASAFTRTSGPWEVEGLIKDLKCRGLRPKVVFVDDECCGAWKRMLEGLWPGVVVRLDGMHAIKRLTQTVTSTQHPWHSDFCAMLSNAIYTYDAKVLERLRKARTRAGLSSQMPKGMKSKYVPRVVEDGKAIFKSISAVLEIFVDKKHAEAGPVLTERTMDAWANLREHIRKGCLCDPPGICMNLCDERQNVTIGGDVFPVVRTLRGTSALEGFHAHQKRWAGAWGHHAMDAGMAMMSEGTVRWNRQLTNKLADETDSVPVVYAGGLLKKVNDLSSRVLGRSAFPGYVLGKSDAAEPIKCLTGKRARVEVDSKMRGHSRHMPRDMAKQVNHFHKTLTLKSRANRIGKCRLGRTMPKQTRRPGASEISCSMPAAAAADRHAEQHAETHRQAQRSSANPLSKCRRCNLTGTSCRYYNHFQWCASEDIPFNIWLKEVYPKRQAEARDAAAKKASRVGGKRGRPKNHATSDDLEKLLAAMPGDSGERVGLHRDAVPEAPADLRLQAKRGDVSIVAP